MSDVASITKILFPPIHKEGVRFIALFAFVTLLLSLFNEVLAFIGIGLTVWCYYFFRNPDRQVIQIPGVAVSPADGVVCVVDTAIPPKELELGDTPKKRVGVFMNVFDCHVNRVPVAGTIEKIAYHKGQFLNASLDKASQKNERNSVLLKDSEGDEYVVVQIAGLVARRIICESAVQESLERGERFGIIRFGSRVDVYLPEKMTPAVSVGQIMVAGETVIAAEQLSVIPDYKTV